MEEKTLLEATVCFLLHEGRVLLARKTRKIGAGCRNGYGGGIDSGESVDDAAVRELEEESGVVAQIADIEKYAIVDFHNTKSDGSTFVCRVHFYIVRKWTGEAKETDEMADPRWFDISNLPFDEMMPADRVFIPVLLSGKKIRVKAAYGPFQKELLGEVELEEAETLP